MSAQRAPVRAPAELNDDGGAATLDGSREERDPAAYAEWLARHQAARQRARDRAADGTHGYQEITRNAKAGDR